MPSAVVTGATGFIGSRLVNALAAQGLSVFAVARPQSVSAIAAQPNIVPVQCDILQYASLPQLIATAAEYNKLPMPSLFYHMVWQGVDRLEKQDAKKQLKNIEYTVDAVHACHNMGCQTYIHIGSVAEYTKSTVLINETLVPSPANVYGATKVAARYLAQQTAATLNQDIMYALVCSTYGPGQKDNGVIPYTIAALLRGQKPSFGNLNQMWDFLHVEDAAAILARIGLYGTPHKTYGVGSGQYKPLRSYIEDIRDCINPALPLGIGDLSEEYSGIQNCCVDITRTQEEIGFVPRVCFRQSIIKMVKGV